MKIESQTEENKALDRRFFGAVENRDFRVFDEIVAQDYNDHLAGRTPGRDTLKRYFTAPATMPKRLNNISMGRPGATPIRRGQAGALDWAPPAACGAVVGRVDPAGHSAWDRV
jgi:hypothetical protein